LCKKQAQTVDILKKCLECYHKRIYAETIYCEFKAAENTFNSAQKVIKQLNKLDALPNLAGLYANFSTLYFHRSEYDEVKVRSACLLFNNETRHFPVVCVVQKSTSLTQR
jgi:hypothetical protein